MPAGLRVPPQPSTPAAAAPSAAASQNTASISVLLFGGLREAAGWHRRHLRFSARADGPITPVRLWEELGLDSVGRLSAEAEASANDRAAAMADCPVTGPQAPVRVAVNQVFASPCTALHPGDEVAFLPPISGG